MRLTVFRAAGRGAELRTQPHHPHLLLLLPPVPAPDSDHPAEVRATTSQHHGTGEVTSLQRASCHSGDDSSRLLGWDQMRSCGAWLPGAPCRTSGPAQEACPQISLPLKPFSRRQLGSRRPFRHLPGPHCRFRDSWTRAVQGSSSRARIKSRCPRRTPRHAGAGALPPRPASADNLSPGCLSARP